MESSNEPKLEYDFFSDGALRARIASMDEALKSTVNSLYSCLESISNDPVKEITKIIKDDNEVKGTYKKLIVSLRGEDSEVTLNTALDKFVAIFSSDQEGELDDKVKDFLAALKILFDVGELESSRKRMEDLSWVLSRLRDNWKPAEETGLIDGTGNDTDFQIRQLLNLYAVWTHLNHQWRRLSTLSQTSLNASHQPNATAPLYLIKKCFRQISTDSEIIQRAILQRQWAVDDTAHFVESQQAKALVVADKLAIMALAPIHARLPGTGLNYPITYFSKSIYFRHTPHNDRILLIGLSYDLASRIKHSSGSQSTAGNEIETAIELMAIPHEVGHYVFHHAKIDGGIWSKALGDTAQADLVDTAQKEAKKDRRLTDPELTLKQLSIGQDKLAEIEKIYNAVDVNKPEETINDIKNIQGVEPESKKQYWILKKLTDSKSITFAELAYIVENDNGWYEELFADMYGCLVTGPLSVLGMQSLIASSNRDHLFKEDGEHPTPVLRPFIMSEMLRVLSELDAEQYQLKAVAKSLDDNWKAFLQLKLKLQVEESSNQLKISSNAPDSSININTEKQEIRPIIRLIGKLLINNATFEPWKPQGENPLSASIPWIQANDGNLSTVIKKMEELTGDDFAKMTVSPHRLIMPKLQDEKITVDSQTARRDLENLYDLWDDKEAVVTSAGSHGTGIFF